MTHAACVLSLALVLLTSTMPLAQDAAADYDAKIRQADGLLKMRQWENALKAYKEANGLKDKKSPHAHLGMARAYEGLRAYKSAADSCSEALKYTGDDKALEATVRNQRGKSLFSLVEKADDKRLTQAQEDFRAVLAMTDTVPIAHFNLGIALMKQSRDDEGKQELERYLQKVGSMNLPEIASAKRFIADPRRAREPFAPDFSITTLGGEFLTLDDLRGKVVLIDFWATWCQPCLVATPGLAKLQKKMDGQPFVILGVSADRSKAAWESFVRDNNLKWHHVLDERNLLTRAFNIEAFPSYLMLDHDGIVRHTWRGWSPSLDGDVESKAKKLLKAIPR